MKKHNILSVIIATIFYLSCGDMVFAASTEAERITIKARVELEVNKDLATIYNPMENLSNRQSIDGRSLENFEGDIIEYWVNLECSYCNVYEPLQAQRQSENIRIVVRHIPTPNYTESLKKALSYEALKKFSANAANLFWDKVVPRTSLTIPVPYEASLLLAIQEANIVEKDFYSTLTDYATKILDADILAAQDRIFSTPTYVIKGIRFPACNFTAKELVIALNLAKKARAGDKQAIEKIIQLIVNGLTNVPMFDKSL